MTAGSRPTVRYRIADDLRDKIMAGVLAPGDRLPPLRDLAEQWQVAPNTIAAALDVLNREGLITVARSRRAEVAAGGRPRPGRHVTAALRELRSAEAAIVAAQVRISALAARRRALIAELHEGGMTYTDIGVAAGITRVRLGQIMASSAPEETVDE